MVARETPAVGLDSTALFLPKIDTTLATEPAAPPASGNGPQLRTDLPVVVRDREGQILYVQISAWRRVNAGPQRRIAQVTPLEGGVAVLVECIGSDEGGPVRSRAWHAYDSDGRLTAVLQLSVDKREALLLNYQTRQACQLARDASGGVRCRQQWAMEVGLS